MNITKPSSELKEISKRVGKAIGDYEMFQDHDRVIVAVSGGKDSLSLLKVLQYRQSFIPVKLELLAVYIQSETEDSSLKKLESVLNEIGVPFQVKQINVLQGKDIQEIDCFWCSWNRRKALFKLAQELGFNKIALGHHLDDIAETILMNLFYRGEISAMRPKQELFNGKIALVRPLAYVREQEIICFAKKQGFLEVFPSCCPLAKDTFRLKIKNILADLELKNSSVSLNILKSLSNIKEDYLVDSFDSDIF